MGLPANQLMAYTSGSREEFVGNFEIGGGGGEGDLAIYNGGWVHGCMSKWWVYGPSL